jgi:hypothetical protein
MTDRPHLSSTHGVRVLLAVAILALGCPGAAAQEEGAGKKESDLDLSAVKQKEVREKFARLEESMERLARLLAEDEPQNALKLRLAFQHARERLLREDMDRVIAFLAERKLDRAIRGQGEVKADLEDLLAILLEKDIDPREILKHIRRLREVVKDLDGIITEETGEKIASDDALAAGATSEALARDLAKLEDLIRREKGLEGKSREADERPEERGGLAALAPEQGAVRKETAALREHGAEAEGNASAAAAGKPAPGKAGGKEGGESGKGGKDGESGKEGGESGKEGGESGKEGGESPEGAESTEEAPPPPEPLLDRKTLERAERAMSEAEKALASGDASEAARATGAARRALEEATTAARDDLERLRRERDFKKLKEDQEATRKDTDLLAARLKDPVPLVPSPDGGAPGKGEVEAASTDMGSASESLGKGRPGGASKSQGEALKKLKTGREVVEATLEELQRALRERILAYLREKFTKMLEEQRALSRGTHSLDLKLKALRAVAAESGTAAGELAIDRKDLQLAERLAEGEEGLTLVAADVIDLLSEDGTTLVFPQIVGEIQADLRTVSALLSRVETGERTQYVQKEIERSIEEILAALEIAAKSPPPPNPNQGRDSQSGAGPLLPASAELKMVRSLQRRVNERTRAFDLARPEGDLDPAAKLEVEAIARKQEEIERMLRKLAGAVGER